jgi:hypothetical protein
MTKNNDDLVPVTEFISASRQNLEIAEAIYAQYEMARERIIQGFFARLGENLINKLPGWSREYAPTFFMERYGQFSIWKESWQGHYRFAIEAYDWGAGMIGGVWRDENALGGVSRNSEILAAINKLHPRDRCRDRVWFEAEVTLRSPAADWRKPEVLWRIHSDAQFLAEVEALFLGWVKSAERLVDAAASRLPQR